MTNLNPEEVNQAKNQLEAAKNILLSVPSDSNTDKIAAALSLYLSLSAAGKQVSLVSPTQITVNFNQLIGVDKISHNFSAKAGRNLIISFPYQEGSIEKVSYNIENDTFNLVIEPREGYPSISADMMKYSSSNGDFDCVVTIGASSPAELKQIYSDNQNLFNQKTVINIDNNGGNTNFAKINLIESTSSSISELMFGLLDQMGLTIEADIATNLLAGLTEGTANFSSVKTTAATFENAAQLLKIGARKLQFKEAKPESLPQFPPPQVQKSQPQFTRPPRVPFGRQPQPTAPSFLRQRTQQQMDRRPFIKPTPQIRQPQPQSQSQPQMQPHPQIHQQQVQQQPAQTAEAGRPPETPPDWLKPKIYKGSTLL